jgi:hypothetical protein
MKNQPSVFTTPRSASLNSIPSGVWAVLAGVGVGLLAIFVFKVPWNTVLAIGFFGLMMFGHFFMHGGHGSHNGHNGQAGAQLDADANSGQENKPSGHAGCH